MSDSEKQRLVDDHFLFKNGDKFLQACGLERDWPDARGIFHNEAKTFLVWVNEEDQLRIISMQQGANLAEVFKRLSAGVSKIEATIPFARDDHLGFVTSCPTNLGTGMRASVHIKLPNLKNNEKVFKSIADQYCLDIRGVNGEHTESVGGVFDISNKRRIGRSEVELVEDMMNGVKALIDAENETEKFFERLQKSQK